jgi:hypothetical protein
MLILSTLTSMSEGSETSRLTRRKRFERVGSVLVMTKIDRGVVGYHRERRFSRHPSGRSVTVPRDPGHTKNVIRRAQRICRRN